MNDKLTKRKNAALMESLMRAAAEGAWEQVLRLLLQTEAAALPPAPRVSFREALKARVIACRRRRPSTQADLRSYAQRFLRYAPFADKALHAVQTSECRELLRDHFSASAHVYHKAYTMLRSVFAYGRRQGWCEALPTAGLELPPVQETCVQPLTLPQIRALLRCCQRREFASMNAPLRLMLWCGVRPTEVQRLRWCDIDARERCVYVESHASKTGGARAVPLRGGARALLREHHAEQEFIAPRDWARQWRRLRQAAHFNHWQQDALRHTFASMHLKHYHNLNLLQEEMGHRDSHLLRTRYLNLRRISASSATVFFNSFG